MGWTDGFTMRARAGYVPTCLLPSHCRLHSSMSTSPLATAAITIFFPRVRVAICPGGKHGLLMLRTRGVCNAPSFWVRRLYPHARRQASDARQHAHLMTDRRGADGRPIRPWCQATVGDERATAEDERAAGGGCAFQPPALAAMLKLHRGRLANTTREHREAALSGRCRYPHCRYQMRSPLDLSLNKMKRRSFEHTVCTTSSSSTSLFGRGNPCA